MDNQSKTFDPNTNEQLVHALELAYKFASGDMSITSERVMEVTSDALGNIAISATDERPENCRNRLQDEGKPIPEMGCSVYGCDSVKRCAMYESKAPNDTTKKAMVEAKSIAERKAHEMD